MFRNGLVTLMMMLLLNVQMSSYAELKRVDEPGRYAVVETREDFEKIVYALELADSYDIKILWFELDRFWTGVLVGGSSVVLLKIIL